MKRKRSICAQFFLHDHFNHSGGLGFHLRFLFTFGTNNQGFVIMSYGFDDHVCLQSLANLDVKAGFFRASYSNGGEGRERVNI